MLKRLAAAVEEAIILAAMLVIAFIVGAVLTVATGRNPLDRGTFLITTGATLAVYLVFLAGFYWRDLRRWRHRRVGRCERCGYDRKGIDAGAACPECGLGA